ncbi:MAG: hypothetical protein IJ494_00235 [Bacteroides sp.]|nr:hypothetical protein [Bacteroides sp.]
MMNMETRNYLFPVVFRKIGWSMFVPLALLGAYYLFVDPIEWGGSKVFALWGEEGLGNTSFFTITTNDGWVNELLIIGLTVSLLFIAFSREKDEDECIANIRMRSLVWAIVVNCSLLIVGTMLVYGLPYFNFMCILLFSMLILFIVKYRLAIRKFRRESHDE